MFVIVHKDTCTQEWYDTFQPVGSPNPVSSDTTRNETKWQKRQGGRLPSRKTILIPNVEKKIGLKNVGNAFNFKQLKNTDSTFSE